MLITTILDIHNGEHAMTQGKRHNPYYQAQAILSRRDHSVYELRLKLTRHGFSAEQVDTTVEQLKKEHLVNDSRFAAAFVESTLRRKAVGPRWLRAKLKQQGIEQSIIDHIFAGHFGNGQEEELLRQAAVQWRGRHQEFQHDHIRLTRFLVARGFSPGAITAYLEQLSP